MSSNSWLYPRNWNDRIQRKYLHPSRANVAAFLSKFYPRMDTGETVDVCLSNELATNGIASLGRIVSEERIREMKDYFLRQDFFNPYRASINTFPLSDVPAGIPIAYCDLTATLRCPYIFDIVNSPLVLNLVAQELGCKPTLSAIYCSLSFSSNKKAKADQNFHRDVDDWKFVKFFLYLDDINTLEDGPHVYIKGSHKTSSYLKTDKVFTDCQIRQSFGAEAVCEVYGPAGTGILANTYGIHKGALPSAKDRMILQIAYSMNPFYFIPRPKVHRQGITVQSALDPYINRLYFE